MLTARSRQDAGETIGTRLANAATIIHVCVCVHERGREICMHHTNLLARGRWTEEGVRGFLLAKLVMYTCAFRVFFILGLRPGYGDDLRSLVIKWSLILKIMLCLALLTYRGKSTLLSL